MFQWEGCFSDGGLHFYIEGGGGAPWRDIDFGVWGGGSEKNCKMGGGTLPTMGNPEICYLS